MRGGPSDADTNLRVVGSRFLPLALATAALAAGTADLGGLALWLGLLAIPCAAAAAFVAVSDRLEDKVKLVHPASAALALAFLVLGCAVRSNAAAGTAASPLATWALLFALVAYAVPSITSALAPAKVTRTKPERRRRRPAVQLETPDVLERAA